MGWILLILGVVVAFFIIKYSRCPHIGCLTLFTGALKSGKTMTALHCALRKYKLAVLLWHLRCLWFKLIRKPLPEKPKFYSNIPVAGVEYVPLTKELFQRKVRIAYKSVVFLSETSLICDSMSFKDKDMNEEICLFFKLYGHMSRGGKIIIETQNVLDNHFGIKRNLNYYYNIDANWSLPFFKLVRFYKVVYTEDKSVSNIVNLAEGIDYEYLLIPKTIFTRYDSYTYSSFTDDKPLLSGYNYIMRHRLRFFYKSRNLKSKKIPSFKDYINNLEVEDDNE